MSDIKSRVQGLNPNIRARDVKGLAKTTDNIYEALQVISARARTIALDVKEELHAKLEEFAVHSDTIEEIHENKEQIEISKFYERMPNPVVIATEEYLDGKIDFRYKDAQIVKEDSI